MRKEEEDWRRVVRKKKKERWERAGICMADIGGGPDPVFFSLSYKTHAKFFISSLFPSVSFTLPLPYLPLSLPFAAAPLSHLFTCLNSLLPGHIDPKGPPVTECKQLLSFESRRRMVADMRGAWRNGCNQGRGFMLLICIRTLAGCILAKLGSFNFT